MRALIALATALLTGSAIAGETLPLAATYGDGAGCQMLKNPADGNLDGTFLTATEHGGLEWSCTFSWIGKGEDFGGEYTDAAGNKRTLLAWSVVALCGGEGIAWPEVFAIEDKGDTVAVSSLSEPESDPAILKQCPR